jgi:hypothetical protein
MGRNPDISKLRCNDFNRVPGRYALALVKAMVANPVAGKNAQNWAAVAGFFNFS